MQYLHSLSLTSAVNDWLANSRQSRILHVFDGVCNVVNERREVLSVVTHEIGNGPFNLVLETDIDFSEHLYLESPVSSTSSQLDLGDIAIYIAGEKLWNPRLDWESLHAKRGTILNLLTAYPISDFLPYLPAFSLTEFSTALVTADHPSAVAAAKRLAGLGPGLTPAGDDFMMGALYAAWIIHPLEVSSMLAEEIANTAAPLTTSLSAAWLKAAGKGEAGILWHKLFDALTDVDSIQIQTTMEKILAVGETSGADALTGFISTLISYTEHETKPCLS